MEYMSERKLWAPVRSFQKPAPPVLPAAPRARTEAQAMEKKFLSNILPIIGGIAGVVTWAFVLIPKYGMTGLYIANILSVLMCLAVITGHAMGAGRRFPKSMEDFLVIPEDFGAGEKERMDIELQRIDEVTEVSVWVIDFCSRQGIPYRKAFFAGLALEEMAGNVVKHGFAMGSGKHVLDIRVVHKGETLIMRILDNCEEFNPLDRLEHLNSGEVIDNIGIRLVHRIAANIQYQNLLGMNVLTIHI